MLTEKEKGLLNEPLPNRDPNVFGDLTIQDAMEIISVHTNKMTPINDTTVSITLADITTIIFDAFMLGYGRGKESTEK